MRRLFGRSEYSKIRQLIIAKEKKRIVKPSNHGRIQFLNLMLLSLFDHLQKYEHVKREEIKEIKDLYFSIFHQNRWDISDFKAPALLCGNVRQQKQRNKICSDQSGSTGKSLSEALIFASTNPQYDDRLFIELQIQYMKIASSEHKYIIVLNVKTNNLCTQHVLRLHFSCTELVIQ